MSDVTKEVSIRLKAIDESKGGFESFTGRLRAIQQEQRASGEGALERTLRGGGVLGLSMFALEGIEKGAEGIREALKAVNDGTMTASEGWGHVIQKVSDAVPVLGGATKAFGEIGRFVNDTAASIYRYFGASEEYVEKEVEDAETVKERYAAISKAFEGIAESRRKLEEQLDIGNARGEDKQLAIEEARYNEQMNAMREAHRKQLEEVNRFSKQYRQIKDAQYSEEQEAERLHQENIGRIQTEADHKAEEEKREHGLRLAQIQASVRAMALTEAGATAEAEITLLRESYKKQISDIQDKAEVDAKENPGRAKEIRDRAGLEVLNLVREQVEKEGFIVEDSDRRRIHEAQDVEARVLQIKSEAGVERLRIAHRDAEADLAQLKANYEAQLKEINRIENERNEKLHAADAETQAKYGPQITKEAADNRAAIRDKYDADVAAAQQREADRKTDQSQNAQRERDEARLGLLHAMGDAGNAQAKVDAERLEITTRIEEKIAEITKQLREQKDLTPQTRATMEETIKDLQRQEVVEKANARIKSIIEEAESWKPAPAEQQGRGMIGIIEGRKIQIHNEAQRQIQKIEGEIDKEYPGTFRPVPMRVIPNGSDFGRRGRTSKGAGADFEGLPGAGAAGYNEAASRRTDMFGRGSDFAPLVSVNQKSNVLLEQILRVLSDGQRPNPPPANVLRW